MPTQSAQTPQVHNTNAPAGPLKHTGLNFCENHRQWGTRCKFCQGQGCEWKQVFDPMAINNPNLKPLQSYGEMMVERDRQNQQNPQGNQQYSNQQRPGNSYGRNNNYGQRFQQQSTQGPAGNSAQYYPPPQVNNANNITLLLLQLFREMRRGRRPRQTVASKCSLLATYTRCCVIF